MTTHQAFIEFSRLVETRLSGLLTVSNDPEGVLDPPYFYLHTGPENQNGFLSTLFVLGRLVVGREQLTDTTWRSLSDTAEWYKSQVTRRLRDDGAFMFEKVDRRTAGNPRTGNYTVQLRNVTGDLSQVDNLAEMVFTFEIQTTNN